MDLGGTGTGTLTGGARPMTAVSAAGSYASTPPLGSPGLFSPIVKDARVGNALMTDGTPTGSPYLHPLQMHKVKETHKAQVEQDFITGRKLINQYEIIDEIGRGVYGKVKLARNLETGEYVAIKIVQRYSKKRRLGKISSTPEDKTKREIAILKKLRHAHVVGLIEVIDDPELKKIYMVLEHVELGEIVWRTKGTPQICQYERRRIEREVKGETINLAEEEKLFKMQERTRLRREVQRANQLKKSNNDYWSLEHGDDEENDVLSRHSTRNSLSHSHHESSYTSLARLGRTSPLASRATSTAPSGAQSRASSRGHTPIPIEWDIGPIDSDNEDELPRQRTGSIVSVPLSHSGRADIDAFHLQTIQLEQQGLRGRSPSMADSIISHMSSVDDLGQHDNLAEDFSYVPCLTMAQIRKTFREVVLGLEYLHYEGIVHRDIKPANLLWTRDYHVKISDFGVSYFGRPTRTPIIDNEESVSEADADFDNEIELAKTVGTPAFFAPELCYTDVDVEPPKIGKQIDIWSLGVTLYCLVFARIPFLAEDEFQLFKAIATKEVYIPKRRLKPVNPAGAKGASNPSIYREDDELAMEDVDEELRDLISGLLNKDQAKRITIRGIKWHPWVVKDIDNVLGWIDDTDPSRMAPGKIEIDDADLDHAVVPLTILERARSAVKKVIGKISRRSESSRKRATSIVTTASSSDLGRSSPNTQDSRRASLRGDEIYSPTAPLEHHPLSQSQSASPDPATPEANRNAWLGSVNTEPTPPQRPGMPDRQASTAASIQTVVRRTSVVTRSPSLEDFREIEEESDSSHHLDEIQEEFDLFTDHQGNAFRSPSSRSLAGKLSSRPSTSGTVGTAGRLSSRPTTAEHGLFGLADKHSEPTIAMSPMMAPGELSQAGDLEHFGRRRSSAFDTTDHSAMPQSRRPSVFFGDDIDVPRHPPLRRPSVFAGAQQSMSSPNVAARINEINRFHTSDTRPATAIITQRETQLMDERQWPVSTKESFDAAQSIQVRRKTQELAAYRKKLAAQVAKFERSNPSSSCPPSPDDEDIRRGTTANSSSTVDSYDLTTAPTSNDSIAGTGTGRKFSSHPSLPTLLSGASSAPDTEEEDMPGIPAYLNSTQNSDSDGTLTNTSDKMHTSLLPADNHEVVLQDMDDDEDGYNGDGDRALITEDEEDDRSDDDDSDDSDEGLIMGRKSRGSLVSGNGRMHERELGSPGGGGAGRRSIARRDTNNSTCSTETAKKISIV